jgi:hypothetical protein
MKNIGYLLLTILLMMCAGHTSYGQIKICEEKTSHHPIDYRLISFRDSLLRFKSYRDTAIIYSHWIYTNGWNGYGKVVWKKNGETFLVKFDYDKELRQVVRRELIKLPNDSIVNFFFENRLDTIIANPDKLTVFTTPDNRTFVTNSHDGSHFISIRWADNEHCFIINDFNVQHSIAHKRVQWINYFKEEGTSIIIEDGVRVREEIPKAIKRKKRK